MGQMAELEVQIRFRHQGGDIGPLSFPLGTSVEAVKQKVYASWPTGEVTSMALPGARGAEKQHDIICDSL